MDQFTIASDDEVEQEVVSDEEHDQYADSDEEEEAEVNAEFEFDDGQLERRRRAVEAKLLRKSKSKKAQRNRDDDGPEGPDSLRAMPHVEERAQRADKKMKVKSAQTKGQAKDDKKKKRKDGGEVNEESSDDEDGGGDDSAGQSGSDRDSDSESESEVDEEEEAQQAYFDQIDDGSGGGAEVQFSQLNLSRSLLRAVERAGYTNPTPIQARVIPLALSGRDVCASAVTGSGKTAAFVLPFLERLLYRPKEVAATRVLVLTPTRELATQIYDVLVKLSVFTDITSALICGGKKDLRAQEATLRGRPDVLVCTPGRIVDHLRNSLSISIADLDVLVLDEVDRLLELGFQEEIEELLKFCPGNRQTLLFSATLTTKVEDLVRLSLKKPVRVKVNVSSTAVAPRLVQEFIKLRDPHEREAYLCSLVCRSFSRRTIVFFETKVEAHRFAALLKLMEVRTGELHGNLQQSQRYAALTDFREGRVDVLVCTDVAARGLDIPGVQCVINSEMPRNTSSYVHRVGRTARAGCGGRSITLVTDGRRKFMKDVLKGSELAGAAGGGDGADTPAAPAVLPQILTRSVPSSVVAHYVAKIAGLESRIVELFHEESVSARITEADREIEKAQNLLKYEDEITSRPARTWYMTETQKQALKTASTEASKTGGVGGDGGAMEGAGEPDAEATAEADEGPKSKNQTRKALRAADKAEKAAKNQNGGHVGGDNYLLSAKDRDAQVGQHRMSRIKRRRQEAMKGVEEENNREREVRDRKREREGDAEAASSGNKTGRQPKPKDAPTGGEDSISAMFARKNPKKARYTKDGANKVIRPSFATGGLDSDMRQWGMLQQPAGDGGAPGGKKGQQPKKTYASREERELHEFKKYDPNKKGLGKKMGTKAFKSKAKFKRR